ncbi:xylulose kinase-1 [Tanacetum coccineum]
MDRLNIQEQEEKKRVINSPCYHNKELASPEQTATAEVVPKSVACSRFPAAYLMLLPFNVQSLEGVCMKKYIYVQKFHVFKSRLRHIGCCRKVHFQSSRYVVPTGRVVVPAGRYIVPAGKVILIVSTGRLGLVPTGRVVVPTGRYIVPAGKVILIVSTGRLSLVPTGRVLSPGSDNDSDDASVHSEATIPQQQRNNQPQYITTVSNNNAKFPYLKKDEYEVWAMKMEYWITNNDMNIWKVIQNGNSLKRTGRDCDGRVIILPPTTADEHIAVQRESKARTTLLQSIPDDHVADFHYMDDARDIWNAVKARFGGNAESKKMRKSMLKQEFSEFRIGDAGEFALMGVTSERVCQKNQLTLEDKIRVLSIELENTTNLLKHSERINAIAETAKKDLQTKLDNHLVQTEKWRTSSKNLFRLVDSSMSVRTKVGLGFNNYIGENELGWDDSAFSVFTTNSEEVEGRPHFNRFAKTDSMKVVPPPLSGDYTPLSDHTDLDESQMSYGTKSSTSGDSNSMSNDFVSCDNSDKSSEVNSNDFASSDSSVKSLEPKSNDSTSCASTSSISTSESEAEIESNVGTPIQETINVQDLPSFSCNSSDKNGNTSRTSCNKNGYFNKKAGHFRKNASSVSKLCFVCGSSSHLIKDCDFYEKQMVNKTVGNGVGPVHSRNNVNHQNQFVPQAVLQRIGKVNITPARPQSVSTGKPKVPATVPTGRQNRPIPVPTGRQNRPIPVPTDRGNSPSVTSGWWQSTDRPMPHLGRPTSSYF